MLSGVSIVVAGLNLVPSISMLFFSISLRLWYNENEASNDSSLTVSHQRIAHRRQRTRRRSRRIDSRLQLRRSDSCYPEVQRFVRYLSWAGVGETQVTARYLRCVSSFLFVTSASTVENCGQKSRRSEGVVHYKIHRAHIHHAQQKSVAKLT